MAAVDELKRGLAPYVNHRFYQPPPAGAVAPGTAVGPATYQPNFTMGASTAPVPPEPIATDVRPKYNPANGSPEAKAWMASQQAAPTAAAAPAASVAAEAAPKLGAVQRMNLGLQSMTGVSADPTRAGGAIRRLAGRGLQVAGKLAAPVALAGEGLQVAQVAADPNATGTDVATQVAQGAGRLGSAGVGAAAGAALGSVVPVVGTALGGIAGGIAGYYGADKAIEASRRMVGVDPRAPADRAPGLLPSAAVTSPAASSATQPGAAAQPSPSLGAVPASPVALAQESALPAAGAVRRVGNSYSGTNVSGDISIVGANGQPIVQANRGAAGISQQNAAAAAGLDRRYSGMLVDNIPAEMTGGGTVSSIDTSQGYASDLRQLAEIEKTKEAQRVAMRDRDTYNQGRAGNFGAVQALTRQAKREAATKQADQQATQANAAQKLAQAKFGLDATGANLDNQAKAQLQTAQQALLGAKTEGERLTATERLRALQGRYEREIPNKFTVVPGGQAVDPTTGQLVREPAQVLDNQTGQFVAAQQAKPAQNFAKGQTYTDGNGRRAMWDGQKFVPAT